MSAMGAWLAARGCDGGRRRKGEDRCDEFTAWANGSPDTSRGWEGRSQWPGDNGAFGVSQEGALGACDFM
jgi:hypothetical protein